MSTISRSSSNIAARHATSPSGPITSEPPSKTISSWPPTAFTYAIQPPNSRARSPQHPGAFLELPPVIRRAVDVGDERDTAVVGERTFRVPGVLAHRQPHRDAADRHLLGPLAGDEVALLVEDPVVRQHDLVVADAYLASGEVRGRVVEPAVGPVHETGDHRTRIGRLGGELLEGGQVVAHELRAEHAGPRADSP